MKRQLRGCGYAAQACCQSLFLSPKSLEAVMINRKNLKDMCHWEAWNTHPRVKKQPVL